MTGCNAEWGAAKKILVHTPGIELALGAECPRAALFEGPLNPEIAIKEHNAFKQRLRDSGAQVIELTDVLKTSMGALRELASDALQYDTSRIFKIHSSIFNSEKEQVLNFANYNQLISIILRRPIKRIFPHEGNTGFVTGVTEDPLYNLMFMRDQTITTDKGIIICAMNSPQRRHETRLVQCILDVMGIPYIHQLDFNGSARMEGGDFIPAGSHSFFGLGSRTNMEGINEVLHGNHIGSEKVYVVHSTKGQDEMHLDTYFNLVGKKRAIILKDNIGARVDLYVRKGNSTYALQEEHLTFGKVLSDEGYVVGEVTKIMQLLYGVNVLTLNETDFVGVDIGAKRRIKQELNKYSDTTPVPLSGLSDDELCAVHRDYLSVLSGIGIDNPQSYLMDFSHLNQAYGGPHCLTQVISRGGKNEVVDK